MQNGGFDQSEADTVIFSAYAVLRESGYSGPVVVDAADIDAYVATAVMVSERNGRATLRVHTTCHLRRQQE